MINRDGDRRWGSEMGIGDGDRRWGSEIKNLLTKEY